jgi:hypothetical protein
VKIATDFFFYFSGLFGKIAAMRMGNGSVQPPLHFSLFHLKFTNLIILVLDIDRTYSSWLKGGP